MKRILTLLLCFIISSSFMTSAFASSYADVPDDAYYKDAVESLSIYGIVSGFDGYFAPDAYVTRAEFSKIAVITGGFEKEVAGRSGNARFNDVPVSHWANGYINTAAENSIIVGYPNGYFMPENNVTYQEAVTVILRLMDYTSADLGDNWPYAYMQKARELGILDGILKDGAELITRGDLCLLIDRALNLDLNGSEEKLISKLDITTTDEVLVIATKNEDKSLDYNTVKTSGGTYELANENLEITPLTKVKFVLNSENEVINSILTYTPEIVTTTIDTVAGDVVYFANNTNSRSLSIKDSTPCYNNGNITSFADVKSIAQEGAKVSFTYEKDGTLGYVIIDEVEYSEPKVVTASAAETIEALGAGLDAAIIRDGLSASIDDIEIYDVCYYQSANNTVYVYSDKISGIYEEAYPSKASVSSVDISGVTLEIETQTAANKLGEKAGSYALNSRVTALLGKDGAIVDVVDLASSSASLYGVLLSVETVIEDNTQETYINLLAGDGTNVKYKTKGDYENKIGYVGKLDFDSDGYAQFTLVNENLVYGEVDAESGKIDDSYLSGDCKIIELLYVPEYHTGTATAQVIDLSDLGKSITKSQCVYAATGGDFGDITALFVKDVTGDGYEYGVLKSSEMNETQMSISGTYNVFTEDGTEETFVMDSYMNIPAGVGVKMVKSGNSLSEIKALSALTIGNKCTAIDYSRIKVRDTIYEVASDALIVVNESTGYRKISVEDAQEYIGKVVRVYTDSTSKNDAQAKVIIFEDR